jgi:hypothetical protein
MMKAARTSETLVNFHQTTRHYSPEDSHIQVDFVEYQMRCEDDYELRMGDDVGRISSALFQFKALTKTTIVCEDNKFLGQNVNVI